MHFDEKGDAKPSYIVRDFRFTKEFCSIFESKGIKFVENRRSRPTTVKVAKSSVRRAGQDSTGATGAPRGGWPPTVTIEVIWLQRCHHATPLKSSTGR
jgi:hypothetical protein